MIFVIVVASFFASLLTLYSGFGLSTLLMPVAAAFFPVATAVALTAFVHLFNNLFKLGTLWRDIHWRVTFRFGIPAVIASIPGALLLTGLSDLGEVATYEFLGIDAV
ncbi:MAG: TSUP family transporter, partial [Pseudohongiellaceae bacterium]